MCGIAGLVYSQPDQRVDSAIIARMCSAIHHRGPDEWGMWIDGAVGMGMKRLRIIDLVAGHQPMSNEDNSLHIVFNGEIYNYKELREDLEKKGHVFLSDSDTESILHLYEEFGSRCVAFLRGMFAFAIWNSSTKSLFIARDRFGKKPMHYLLDSEMLVFGSEIKSILCHPSYNRKVNRSQIVNYLAYGNSCDPFTMFEGIKKLPPGHTLTWCGGRASIERYWDISFVPNENLTEAECLAETERLLAESVAMRLASDVPLGAFLSGGIDSSLVVAYMARYMTTKVKTFTIGFEDAAYDELAYARIVAKRFGTDHHELIVTPDAEEVIPRLVEMFDEPFADSSAIPTYYLSKLARSEVTVALSGDGGDEVFGGYGRYRDSSLCRMADHVPIALRRPLFRVAAELLPYGFKGLNTLRALCVDSDERYILKMSKNISGDHRHVFSEGFLRDVGFSDPSSALEQYLSSVGHYDDITRRQYLDMKTYLPFDILTKVDRASMLVSLEVRSPLLDHKLVEFAATIPSSIRVKDGELKHVLKQLARKHFSADFVDRSKMGFAIPVGKWMNTVWKDICHELVLGQRALERDNFKISFLERLMSEHHLGRRDHSYLLWTLMVLEMWYRRYIDGK